MILRAIGYVRVSTDEQAQEGVSLDNQKAKIRAYCNLHDLELDEIIEDAGRSGKNLNREGVQSLIERIKEREIDAVIVYKLDRLSRKVLDTLNLIELMKKHRVAFHSITDNIDTKTAIGKFFLNIMASLAEMERDLIAERTKDALRHKIENNERAGQIPYGWTLAPDGKALIAKDDEQEIIRLIRDRKDDGLGYRAICRELEGCGYKPVGRLWHPQTIKNILHKASPGI